jgi:hypothetical protein
MKRISLLAGAFVFVLIFSGCSPALVSPLTWQSTPVVADGKLTEWKAPLRFYDSNSKLNYVVTNDKENLYICIRIPDEQSQMKIMRAGMDIWIDTTGKKNKQVGISFPLPAKARSSEEGSENRSEYKRGEKGNTGRWRKKLLDESNEILLTGFNQPMNGLTARQNTYGLNIGINWDTNNIMIYEAVIPFRTFYKPELTKTDSLKDFGFSIVVNGISAPERNNSGGGGGMPGGMGGGRGMGGGGMGGGGGMPGGGGMGGRGGGMGGGHRGGGGMGGGGGYSQSNPLYETNKFWVKVRLASK